MAEVDLWPIVIATTLWSVAFPLLYYFYKWVLDTFCVQLPLDCIRIPKELPHPDPPGEAQDFPVPLLTATPAERQAFMKFRGCIEGLEELAQEKPGEGALRRVAEEAVRYKGELVDTKHGKWDYEHFELRKKGLAFPVREREREPHPQRARRDP